MATHDYRTRSREVLDAAWSIVLQKLEDVCSIGQNELAATAQFGEEIAAALPAELTRIRADIALLHEHDRQELDDLIRLKRS
jgi:hypothetical protein